MNKKLVAVAIGGLLAAPLAQAQTANVTLYGRVNMDMEVVNGKQAPAAGINACNTGASCANPNVFRVSSNSSRFGLQGTEALGGGLSAIFRIENAVSTDTGNGSSSGIALRDAYVGLQGAWGTVKLGNFLSPYDDIHPIFGSVPTLLTSIVATSALWAQGSQNNFNGGFDNRNPNSVRYDSPNMSGFTGSVQYSASGGSNAPLFGNEYPTAPRGNSGIWSLGGFYNNGPAQFGIAYTQNNSVRGAGLTDQALSIAGGWQFSGFRISAVWERLDYDYSTTTNLKRDFWNIAGTINLGPGQMYVSYGQAYDGKGSAPDYVGSSATGGGARIGVVTKGPDTGANMWTISYTYPLSKRTLMYTGYVKISNDKYANYNFATNGYAPANGGDPQGFMLGTVHFF